MAVVCPLALNDNNRNSADKLNGLLILKTFRRSVEYLRISLAWSAFVLKQSNGKARIIYCSPRHFYSIWQILILECGIGGITPLVYYRIKIDRIPGITYKTKYEYTFSQSLNLRKLTKLSTICNGLLQCCDIAQATDVVVMFLLSNS